MDTKSPTVSVVMATYNHAKFVRQAIESVLAQDGVDFEFLISDDGSTDRTREVVSSVKDERIVFIPNQVNRGACVVMNELIERSSGKYVAIINSDDVWSQKDKLSYQVDILERHANIGACFGRAQFIDCHGKVISPDAVPGGDVFNRKNRSQGQWLRRFFDFGNCLCHPTVLIRRSCYGRVGEYDNRLRQLPDLDMWIRLVKKCDIYVSDRTLVQFRLLPGRNASSPTTSNSVRTMNEHYLIADHFFNEVTREQMIDGFGDLLSIKDLPSPEHLFIEQNRLLLMHGQWLSRAHSMAGLLKTYKMLGDSKLRDFMQRYYGMDDRWFQDQMAELGVLRPEMMERIMGILRSVTKIARLKSFWHGGALHSKRRQ